MAIRVELGGEQCLRRECPACASVGTRPRLLLVGGQRAGGRSTARTYVIRRAVAVLVVVLLATGMSAALTAVTSGAQAPDAAAAEPAALTSGRVVLAPGETLWELLAPHTPAGTDRQAFIAQVLRANDLHGRAILPGQALRLPAR